MPGRHRVRSSTQSLVLKVAERDIKLSTVMLLSCPLPSLPAFSIHAPQAQAEADSSPHPDKLKTAYFS